MNFEDLCLHADDWEHDCLLSHGRVLTGQLAHWCAERDGLPLDETTTEIGNPDADECPYCGFEGCI